MSRAWWLRPALLVALVLTGTVVLFATGVPSLDSVRDWTGRAGWAAPAVFALLYAGFTLVPAPATVLTIAAGVLFGLPVGFGATMAGAVTGAMIAFGLSRGLGRSAVTRIGNDRLTWLDERLSRRGLLAVIGIRLVPVIPFPALNYACGLTGIGARDYLVGTVVGIVPSAAAYTTIGAYGADPGSAPFLLAVGGLAVLVVGGVVVSRRRTATGPTGPTAPIPVVGPLAGVGPLASGGPTWATDDTRPLNVVGR